MMHLESPLFDRIRVRPKAERVTGERGAEQAEAPKPAQGGCEHPGCLAHGEFRAPKGRGQEGRFWRFCLEHVRAYNQSYNYFAGMPDDAVLAFQKDATTGHRPTWTMGVNPATQKRGAEYPPHEYGESVEDPLGMFGPGRGRRPSAEPRPERRRVGLMERRAFETLDLPDHSAPAEIKARYKALVKRLHPDANGGDRSCEEKLRGIIQAYNTLRGAGYC